MILSECYDPETGIQKVWYKSSSIFFSSYDESTNTLHVVFNNGTAYDYFKVDLASDYMLFKEGYIEGSQGKSLNKFIKGKYEYKKTDNEDISKLAKEMEDNEKEISKARTYFISGHRDITEEEFFNNYAAEICMAIENDPDGVSFVVGDYYGVDIMAQNYLLDELKFDPERVTVYHMFDSPRNVNPKVVKTKGGFKTDEERDAQMTADSGKDIAFVRDHLKLSGTAMNLLRRRLFL